MNEEQRIKILESKVEELKNILWTVLKMMRRKFNDTAEVQELVEAINRLQNL